MKVKPRLPGRQGALLSQAESAEYCLSANSASNLILQRFLQRSKQRDGRRMCRVYSSVCIFYHSHILQDLGHQLFVTSSQLFIFQERYHSLPFIYLPVLLWGNIIYFLLPSRPFCHLLPSIPVQCPGMMGFVRLEEKLLHAPHLPRDTQKGTKASI